MASNPFAAAYYGNNGGDATINNSNGAADVSVKFVIFLNS